MIQNIQYSYMPNKPHLMKSYILDPHGFGEVREKQVNPTLLFSAFLRAPIL